MKYSGDLSSNTEGANGLKSSLNFTYLLSLSFMSISLGSERIEHNENFMNANEWSHLSFGTCYYSSTWQKCSFNSPNSGFSCKTFLVFAKIYIFQSYLCR